MFFFFISSSHMFIVFHILFCIESYVSEKIIQTVTHAREKLVPSNNLWCSCENQTIIVMCTPGYYLVMCSSHIKI